MTKNSKDGFSIEEEFQSVVILPKDLKTKVFEALGEVSMCWSETPKGVFESSRAEEIGNRLMHDIKMQKPVIDEDNMREYIKQINDLGVEVVKIEPSVKEAVEVLCNALKEDPSYYISWQANIAMAFYDEYCRYFEAVESVYDKSEVHLIANEAAKNFLNLLIKK